jgi:hypothetical protein
LRQRRAPARYGASRDALAAARVSRALASNNLSANLPAAVKGYLLDLHRRVPGSQLLFIRQHYSPGPRLRCFVVAPREARGAIAAFEMRSYDDLLTLDLAGALTDRERARWVPSLYLVCTHGTHDKCCARFGVPVYDALRRAGADVWQCSHVGGDRFAANVICYPDGLCYGRVTPEDATALLNASRAGQINLQKLRGRVCYQHHEQAAEFYVRAATGITAVAGLYLSGSTRTATGAWHVQFVEQSGQSVHHVVLRRREGAVCTRRSCADDRAEPLAVRPPRVPPQPHSYESGQ